MVTRSRRIQLTNNYVLSQAHPSNRRCLILIDTPGLARADMEDARELAQMIGSDPDIDTHLVLPASMRPADLARQVDQFRAFHPRKPELRDG